MKTEHYARPPSPRHFHSAILKVLGKAVRPGQVVYYDTVLDPIIKVAGFDPENLAQYGDPAKGWRKEGRCSPPGFYRQIHIAVRYLSQSPKCKVKLCRFGDRRGWWGLTKEGSHQAAALNGPNITALHLENMFREVGGMQHSALYRILFAAIGRKLPVSQRADLVEDHIQQCVMLLIARDALRNRIEKGLSITPSAIAAFAINSAINDCRDMARNPICRELYGARTDKERKTRQKVEWGGEHTSCPLLSDTPANWNNENANSTLMVDVAEVPDVTIDEWLDFEAVFLEMQDAIQDRKPLAWQRYSGIVRMKVEGATTKDICVEEGVSRHRAATILAETRRVLREARHEGALGLLNGV